MFHCVTFTPEDLSLVEGGPERRRTFLDLCSAQLHAPMLGLVRRYQLALQQRNAVLKQRLPEAQAAGLPCLISDGVPIECKKTDLVHALPLSAGTDAWGAELLRLARTGRDARRDTSEEIRAAGFDITENARWLRDFYLGAVGRS